jgi:hypothetical protein
LYCDGGLGGASIIRQDDQAEPVWVDSQPLLEIVRKHGLDRIDALKIDIEGAEDMALTPFFETAPKNLWPGMVVIENCHRSLWKTDVIDVMARLGYRVRAATRGNLILELR